MGQSIREKYGALFEKVASVSKAAAKITEFNNYQEANPEAKKFADLLVTETIPDSSEIKNLESLKDLYDRVTTKGQSGLIMAEHYSNLDFPEILYILEKTGEPWAKDMASRIVAIAGMKLNESGAFVRLYAESFTRVVVYPSRSQASFQGTPEEKEAEVQRAKKINFAAMRAMDQCKKRGQIILVFPAGTRYRPGKEETKRGLREMDSYLRLFDNMVLLSLNGNCLKINPDTPDDMLSDILEPEKITITASPVIECKAYRKKVIESLPADCPDPKQATVDEMMKILYEMHEKEDKIRAQEK